MTLQSQPATCCVAVVLLTWTLAASAGPSLDACVSIDDDAARLACYDQVAGRSARHAPASVAYAAEAEPATAEPTAAAVTAMSDGERDFGLSDADIKRRDPDQWSASRPESITRTIKSVSRDGYGRFVLTLDDGQVWAQTEIISGIYPRSGEAVTITRGQMGGFSLRSERFGTVRVRRIR